ncbi:MAG: uracil-DNA glycosylase family protein [Planctomycetota bacterium]
MRLPQALREARGCTLCEPDLPLGARPLLQGSGRSRLLIIGQAPGAAAHESGTPWDDRSGQRLREWLGLTSERFYDPSFVALMPMGFCYPGTGASGDLPPRPECAPLWHDRLLRAFRGVCLTLYLGKHAHARYLGDRYATLTQAVAAYDDLLPEAMVLPHPSPRNNIWLKKNAWFLELAVPRLRQAVGELLRAS